MRNMVLTSLLFAACGGGMGSGGLTDDVAGDDTTSVDGGHASTSKVGSVSVNTWSYVYPTGPFAGSSMGAQFYPQPPTTWDTPETGCYMQTFVAGVTYAQASAGTVRFGTSPATTLVPDGSGTYMAASTMTPIASGTNISIDVSGATVPAFTTSATIPAAATLTQPAIVDSKITLNRASDLVVKWTGGGGDVSVGVGSTNASGSMFVYCTFAASAHQGTVPANLMTQLPAGAMGSFAVTLRSQTKKDVGDWTIWTTATNAVTTSSGNAASATATLQ